jgi:hypothetical protein
MATTAAAYRRALDVAHAAGLAEIARAAALSLGRRTHCRAKRRPAEAPP